jgi:hypothetical protein
MHIRTDDAQTGIRVLLVAGIRHPIRADVVLVRFRAGKALLSLR